MVTLIVCEAKSNLEKIIGLIGKNKPYAFLIHTRFGIHTFGVKFPIDVIILNDDSEITYMYESMKSNRIFVWNPIFSTVLELPEGTIKKHKLTKGTKIKLVIQ